MKGEKQRPTWKWGVWCVLDSQRTEKYCSDLPSNYIINASFQQHKSGLLSIFGTWCALNCRWHLLESWALFSLLSFIPILQNLAQPHFIQEDVSPSPSRPLFSSAPLNFCHSPGLRPHLFVIYELGFPQRSPFASPVESETAEGNSSLLS